MAHALLSLIQKAKNEDEEAILFLINKFSPKIMRSLQQTTYQEQEDLRQEIHLKIIEAVRKYDLEQIPDIWNFINPDDFSARTLSS
ncbi:helix-turn-helix domain-containing protein [Paenibacillus sp. PsM32]|uniref:helix-turn-helix domain-containing protein n=1 Tax=unclassified Paenibacillus TaxID=185978 RepID=UPI00263AE308|nr:MULTISPECIES: helix-turn-helix domain-containing protein [unclassified Paenibacillus]MDN4620096.1 helix-turn-helix domain-containing protein [Paenibacillus sp. PsM32]MDQ1236176.1 DNA-directed RNA polymerase specialized sigma subunit [Paenibacillus sp. SORGH_AS_0306]MDR6108531.1 DNA-directed RNA polymerase specialized sigma subunit [Paenibacillus sp. SORGH_AS_0338]